MRSSVSFVIMLLCVLCSHLPHIMEVIFSYNFPWFRFGQALSSLLRVYICLYFLLAMARSPFISSFIYC